MKRVFSVAIIILTLIVSVFSVAPHTSIAKGPDFSKAAYVSINVEDKGYQTMIAQLSVGPDGYCGGKVENGWCYSTMYKHQLPNGFFNWTMSPSNGSGDALFLTYGEYRVGLVIDGKWQTPNEAYANNTELECLNAQSQYVFTASKNPDTNSNMAAISVGCDNLPHLMNIDLAYAPLDHKTTHTVSFYSTLNGWQEAKANVNTSNGVYWYHYTNVVYNKGDGAATQWAMGAMIDGKWYTGDNLYADGMLLTCRDTATGQVQFKINSEQKVRTICENIPRRVNIDVTYVPLANEKNQIPNILGSFNDWKSQAITVKNTDGNYVTKFIDLEVGSYAFGYLINNMWRSDVNQSWVNGTQIASTNSQHQLTFCLGNDWKVKSGNCQ